MEWFDRLVSGGMLEIHSSLLDSAFVFLTTLGNNGFLWILIGSLLLIRKDTRKYGFLMLIGFAVGVMIGNGLLKNLVARPRPCWRDPSIVLLIPNPTDYSFPSGHTMHAFIATTILWKCKKLVGVVSGVIAVGIGLSRLYLQVHYPTDVLFGALIGITIGWGVYYVGMLYFSKGRKEKMNEGESSY